MGAKHLLNRLQMPNETAHQYVFVVIERCNRPHRLCRLFPRLPQGLSQSQQRPITGLNPCMMAQVVIDDTTLHDGFVSRMPHETFSTQNVMDPDFLDYFGVSYTPKTVNVNCLHILQRFHDCQAPCALIQSNCAQK